MSIAAAYVKPALIAVDFILTVEKEVWLRVGVEWEAMKCRR